MKDEELYKLIDDYLEAKLPADHPFHSMLVNDQQLSEEVEIQKIVRSAVVEKRLQQVSDEIRQFRPAPEITSSRKYVMAGVLFLLAILGTFFYLRNSYDKVEIRREKKTDLNEQYFPGTNDNGTRENLPVITVPQSPNKIFNNTAPKTSKEQQPITLSREAVMAAPEVQAGPEITNTEKSKAETEIIKSPENLTKVILVCDTTQINSEIAIIQPCANTATGTIRINTTKGGLKPYEFSLDEGQSFQKMPVFGDLNSGQYHLMVKDRNNCIKSIGKGITLSPKVCIEKNYFSFDPTNQTLDIPSDKTKSGKITIVDKGGHQVYFKNFSIQDQLIWNGTSQNGETLQPGLYIYVIEHADGSINQGEITLSY